MIHTVSLSPRAAALLGEEGMLRIQRRIVAMISRSAARSTSETKSFGPWIDVQAFQAVEAADDDFAGAAGGTDGDVEKRVFTPVKVQISR